MNTVQLIGRLTKDIDIREYGKGKNAGVLGRLTVAVQRDKDNADFISCVCFGRTAELIDTYFTKGDLIGLTGSIQTGKYEDKDGNTRYTSDVVIRQIDFINPKKTVDDDDVEDPPFDEDEEDVEEKTRKKTKSRR